MFVKRLADNNMSKNKEKPTHLRKSCIRLRALVDSSVIMSTLVGGIHV